MSPGGAADVSACDSLGRRGSRARLAAVRPDICSASEHELEALGCEPAAPCSSSSAARTGTVVRARTRRRGTRPSMTDVVDTTGAGDALAAGFLVGGIAPGLEAAARCVSEAGAMP